MTRYFAGKPEVCQPAFRAKLKEAVDVMAGIYIQLIREGQL